LAADTLPGPLGDVGALGAWAHEPHQLPKSRKNKKTFTFLMFFEI